MTSRRFTSSRSDGWTNPRPYSDPSLRFAMHGAIRPMVAPSLLERLIARLR